jgi:hypothetical protein
MSTLICWYKGLKAGVAKVPDVELTSALIGDGFSLAIGGVAFIEMV